MQTGRIPRAIKLNKRRLDRVNCMTSSSRAIGASANGKTVLALHGWWASLEGSARCADRTLRRGISTLSISLITAIDEDLPPLDTLQFQNPALEPGIVL